MKILLTGGSGDLGTVLAQQITNNDDTALRFDVREPRDKYGEYLSGSILDRQRLQEVLSDVDCIVHIAAWHGYHEFTKKKDAYDFWDLNVTGTFNVFQAAVDANIKNILFISSESVTEKNGIYSWTKILNEQIAQRFFDHNHLNILTLRPRAFIPYWNHEVYNSFIEWAKWYWKGAVHIDDVAQAVLKGINLLSSQSLSQHLVLPVDGAYEYTQHDLQNWDNEGKGATFKKYYAKYYDLAINYDLDPSAKPSIQDISATKQWLGYEPHYSLLNLLDNLSELDKNDPNQQ